MITIRLATVLGIAIAMAVAACTDLPSDPKTPFSVAMRPRTSRVVVLGDTLRDSSCVAAPLRVVAFNLDGDSIPGAAATYLAAFADSVPVTVDAATGFVVAKSERGFAGRRAILVANVGALQTAPETVRVTQAPDAVVALDALEDTIAISFANITHDQFRVRVRRAVASGEPAADTVVAGYEVRYSIVDPVITSPTDTSFLYWPSVRRGGTLVATTDTNGVANASLRIRTGPLLAREPRSVAYSDTVIVRARIVVCGRLTGSVDFLRVLEVPARTSQ